MTYYHPKKDPTTGDALLILAAIACICGYLLIPAKKLNNLAIILPQIDTLGTIVLVGIIYMIFSIFSWIHQNLTLHAPGKTISAMQSESNKKKITVRWLILAIIAIPIAALITHLLAFQSKLLADSLEFPTNRWWLPAFIGLIPFGLSLGALSWQMGAKLKNTKSKSSFLPPFPGKNNCELQVTLGSRGEETNAPQWVILNEKDLLKSMMITGGVGFGKTQLIFRILDQLFAAFPMQSNRKIAFLILDPKGDMVPTIRELAGSNDRSQDLTFIGTNHATTWNPLYFPDVQLSGRFRDVAERFKAAMINYQGGSSSDPFWIESGTNLVGWLIWLSATAMGDVTFGNLYKLLLACSTADHQGKDPLDLILKQAEGKIASLEGGILTEQRINLDTCRLYLANDFRKMPDKTRMNVVANLSSFLQLFLTAEAQRMFSPQQGTATLGSMSDVIEQGQILVLDMTQNDRPGLCRAVGTFLKLSYQNAIMSRLAGGQRPERLACLVLDEYQNFATSSHGETQFGDDRFFDQCRAAKGFGIVATQSYATLTMVFKREAAAHELLGQIAHKITFATDEPSTCAYFRRLAGKKWVKRRSESISESSSNARKLLFQKGVTTEKASVGMSYSTSEVEVDTIKDEDIAKLVPFKAYAALKLADGPETDFLYTRPLFDPKPHLPFKDLLLRIGIILGFVFFNQISYSAVLPNICDAVRETSARSCFDIRIGRCTCRKLGVPYPCAKVSYWVPKAFVEVSPRIGESYFATLPTVRSQLTAGFKTWNWAVNKMGASGLGILNHGLVDDHGTSFFHVHTAPVFFSHEILKALPCGSSGHSFPCLSAISEHHPIQWSTGYFDFKQPQLAASQLCGGATEIAGSVIQSSKRLLDGPIGDLLSGAGIPDFGSPHEFGCSIPMIPTLGSINISSETACLGSLGSIFPRYGSVNGSTNVAGALMAAYKFRSLAAEHFRTVPRGNSEKWQMLRPKATSCFYPGENFALVEGLFTPAIRDQFLFLVWEKRSCCVEHIRAGLGQAFFAEAKAACSALGR